MKIKSAVLMCHPSTPTNEMMADASPMADIMAEMNEGRVVRGASHFSQSQCSRANPLHGLVGVKISRE
jgi:hypothetical protein